MLNCIVWNRTVYLYKMGLALNNLKQLICHKIQTKKNKQKDEHTVQFSISHLFAISLNVKEFYLNNR